GDCPPPPRLDFAEPLLPTQPSYPEGAVVRYRCRPGFARNGTESPVVTCLADSSWLMKSVFCARKSCGPPDIANGNFHTQTDLLFGATVTFTCHVGYHLVGRPSAECVVRNGEVFWNSIPYCQIILCPLPPAIENGQLLNGNEDFTFGMAASYSCNKGFALIGEATIICTLGSDFHGVWSGPAPECKEVKCENPQVPNGQRFPGFNTEYTYGDTVIFECNPGYSINGSSVVTCNENSTWTPPLPTCDEILCGRPPELPFATPTSAVGNSSAFGKNVTYQCKPGYKKVPGKSSVITCQSNRTWSAADPQFCVIQQCSAPTVDHGSVDRNATNFTFGAVVTFTCDPQYTLEKPSATCVAAGGGVDWDPKPPYCQSNSTSKEVTCPRPPSIANGQHSGHSSDRFSRGVTVSYSCREGFQLLGNVSITCTDSGLWSRPLPRCEG
ncbi:ZP3R protein, partial [Drymodes brunneopygia]|nr:ZP3R protein [Drymodes brunneopygia]